MQHQITPLVGDDLKVDCCGDRYPCNREYECSCGLKACGSCIKNHLFYLHKNPEWETKYYDAIFKCVERYREMASKNEFFDLVVFLSEFEGGIPLTKLNRWLGYVQGVLIERKATTVEEERNWTRPLFRPLDFG